MSNKNCVKIAVRVKNNNDIFVNRNSENVLNIFENAILCEGKCFIFDTIFRNDSSQQDVFDSLAAPLVEKTLEGFNSTIFAYGQSGTGKSYSMGLNPEFFETDEGGIIPRSINKIFANLENQGDAVKISCSFVEIYNDKAFDLLSNQKNHMTRLTDATKKDISSIQCGLSLLKEAHKERRIRSTNLNSESSRGHTILTIHITKDIGNNLREKSCLNLVDLAGTEGVRKTNHQGMALTEGNYINSSLLAVSRVINALSSGQKIVPYRDSILTKYLQESFSANAYLALLVCVSPNRGDLLETKSSLQFAKNAKNIQMSSELSKEIEIIKKNTPQKLPDPRLVTSTIRKRPLCSTNLSSSKISRQNTTEKDMFKRPKMQRQLAFTSLTPFLKVSKERSSNTMEPLNSELANSETNCMSSRLSSRKSSIDSISSRYSTQSMSNVSTSTINGEDQSECDSPLVKKCLAIIERSRLERIEPESRQIDHDLLRSIIREELTLVLSTIKKRTATVSSPEESPMKQYLGQTTTEKVRNEIRRSLSRKSFNSSLNSINEEETDLENTCMHVSSHPESDPSTSKIKVEATPTTKPPPLRRSMRLSVCGPPPSLNEKILEKNMILSKKAEMPLPKIKVVKKTKNKEKIVDEKEQRSKRQKIEEHKQNFLRSLNSGNAKELQKIPTFGPKRTQQIIVYQSINGVFEKIEDLRQVPIWSDKTWETFLNSNCLI